MVWEAYRKGVPLLGVPENPIDGWKIIHFLLRWSLFRGYMIIFGVYLSLGSMISDHGNPSGAPPPPKATPPREIAGLIKGLLTIGVP